MLTVIWVITNSVQCLMSKWNYFNSIFPSSYLHTCDPPIIHGNLTTDTIFIQHNGLIKIGSGKSKIWNHSLIPVICSLQKYHGSPLTLVWRTMSSKNCYKLRPVCFRHGQGHQCIFSSVKETVNFYWSISWALSQWPLGMEAIAFVASSTWPVGSYVTSLYGKHDILPTLVWFSDVLPLGKNRKSTKNGLKSLLTSVPHLNVD